MQKIQVMNRRKGDNRIEKDRRALKEGVERRERWRRGWLGLEGDGRKDWKGCKEALYRERLGRHKVKVQWKGSKGLGNVNEGKESSEILG